MPIVITAKIITLKVHIGNKQWPSFSHLGNHIWVGNLDGVTYTNFAGGGGSILVNPGQLVVIQIQTDNQHISVFKGERSTHRDRQRDRETD